MKGVLLQFQVFSDKWSLRLSTITRCQVRGSEVLLQFKSLTFTGNGNTEHARKHVQKVMPSRVEKGEGKCGKDFIKLFSYWQLQAKNIIALLPTVDLAKLLLLCSCTPFFPGITLSLDYSFLFLLTTSFCKDNRFKHKSWHFRICDQKWKIHYPIPRKTYHFQHSLKVALLTQYSANKSTKVESTVLSKENLTRLNILHVLSFLREGC